jgi:hypothetical protein
LVTEIQKQDAFNRVLASMTIKMINMLPPESSEKLMEDLRGERPVDKIVSTLSEPVTPTDFLTRQDKRVGLIAQASLQPQSDARLSGKIGGHFCP